MGTYGQDNTKVFLWKLWWRWNCEYLAQRIFLYLQHNSTEGMYVCVHVQTSIVSIQTLCWFLIFIYCMTGNIDVELNLMVGEITHVWPNFIPFYALKTLNAYTLISKCVFQIARLLWHVPLDLQVSRLTKVSADLAYESFVTKYVWLTVNESRWTEMVINLCVECSLIPMIDSSIYHRDKDTLFVSFLLHKLPFIKLLTYII